MIVRHHVAVFRDDKARAHASPVSGHRRTTTKVKEASKVLGQFLHLLLIARILGLVLDQDFYHRWRGGIYDAREIGQVRHALRREQKNR